MFFELCYADQPMSTDLVAEPLGDMPISKYASEEDWGLVVSSSTFLPRIMLYGGSSDACKEGKIGMGHFGLVKSKESIDFDYGNSFDCYVLSWRYKAMDVSDKNAIISVFDPKSEEWKRIFTASSVKDSGCMYGIEYLLWTPINQCFATYYMNSATARREAPNVKQLLGKSATLKSKLINNGKFKWHGPVIVPCSTPFEMPSKAEALAQADRFANPKDSQIEKVAEPASTDRPQ